MCAETEADANFRFAGATRRRGVKFTALPGISPKSRVVEGVETVVVGEGDVGTVVQEECQHIVAFFRNGIVKRSVALEVLQKNQ